MVRKENIGNIVGEILANISDIALAYDVLEVTQGDMKLHPSYAALFLSNREQGIEPAAAIMKSLESYLDNKASAVEFQLMSTLLLAIYAKIEMDVQEMIGSASNR